jgi:hypothetical protein
MYTEHKMTYFEKIVDVNTGEETLRPYTDKEITLVEESLARANEVAAEAAAKSDAKAALLTKLGITEDEAALLLGGN